MKNHYAVMNKYSCDTTKKKENSEKIKSARSNDTLVANINNRNLIFWFEDNGIHWYTEVDTSKIEMKHRKMYREEGGLDTKLIKI